MSGKMFLVAVLFAMVARGEQPFLLQCRGRMPLVVNADNDHYFKKAVAFSRFLPAEERWSEAGLRKYIDTVSAGGKVTHLFACAVGQRASYDSKACDPIWLGIDEAKARGEKPDEWPVNAKKLHDAGLDCFRTWCEYGRTKGLSVWISQRMNDMHFGSRFTEETRHFRNNRFWSAHPELHRRPDGKTGADHAFDFAKEGVREFAFAIFRELVDRYDADGFELDFMRWTNHLTPGRERELSGVLTDYIARCRDYANAKAKLRGHPILLSSRVPSNYAAARALGYDPEEWARRGLVDLIVVTDFYAAADYDCDFPGWKARLARANPSVVVLPGLNDNVGCCPGFRRDIRLADLCGWADNSFAAGAQGLYLFNAAYFGANVQRQVYWHGLGAAAVREQPRTYLASYHDVSYRGVDNGCRFPIDLTKGGEVTILVGSVAGGAPVVVFGCNGQDARCPRVSLNGFAPLAMGETPVAPGDVCDKLSRAWRLGFPVGAVKPGRNVLSFKPQSGGGLLQWAEIAE